MSRTADQSVLRLRVHASVRFRVLRLWMRFVCFRAGRESAYRELLHRMQILHEVRHPLVVPLALNQKRSALGPQVPSQLSTLGRRRVPGEGLRAAPAHDTA